MCPHLRWKYGFRLKIGGSFWLNALPALILAHPCQISGLRPSGLELGVRLGLSVNNRHYMLRALHHREGVMSGDDLQVIHFFYLFLIHGLFPLLLSPHGLFSSIYISSLP